MKKKRKISLFVLIDALGWPYVDDNSFLADVLTHRRPLKTVLGFSSGAIPTILTGAMPSTTGHWNLFYYDPVGSPFKWLRHFRFLPDAILCHRITTRVIKELGRRFLGLGPLFECCVSPRLLPWFNWIEKRNIYAEGGISGAASIFDELGRRSIPYKVYSYHHLTDQEILRSARRDMEQSDSDFLFLYLSEMDMFLHTHCGEPSKIQEKLKWYERELRVLFQDARAIDPDATFTVLSDHGMTPVRNRTDVLSKITSLPLRLQEDYLAIYDSTMARFWFFSDKARMQILQTLTSVTCGRILPEAELRDLGIWFDDGRYGEAVFLLDPGWLFSKSDFSGGGWSPAGMHGYHPNDPYSDAIFLSNRRPPVDVQTIADVYPCMVDALQ